MEQYRFELIDSLKVNNTLGEGVIWNKKTGAIWWADIQQSKLFRYLLDAKSLHSWSLCDRIGCFGFTEKSDCLIVAFASGLAYYTLDSPHIEWLGKPEADVPGNRFNDGRVDRQGRFWAGTMVEDKASSRLGGLYRVDGGAGYSQQAAGIHIANGLCWSPDSRFMYHADSALRSLYVYDFNARQGVISNRRLFATTDSGCYPDGATVDSNGTVFSAQWGGSRIVRYSPQGDALGVLKLPVSQPTCVAFGGVNLDLLLVTTAREGLSEEALAAQPEAGNLLIYQTPFCGIEESVFKTG